MLTDDDDSIDAVFIEKDKVIEETKAYQDTNSRCSERLLSVTSSTGSEISLNQSIKITTSNKKRRKLLQISHNDSFYQMKKTKRIKKGNLSSNSTDDDDEPSSDDETNNSITKSIFNGPSSSVNKNDDDEEVIECCSQSLVFASKDDKILKLNSLSKKKIQENNKAKALSLFKPLSTEKKVKKAPENPNILREQIDRLNMNRVSINSPTVQKNSKLMDEIITSKENEQEKSKSNRRGPRRLFDATSQDVDSAFDDPKPKTTTNSSISTTKSSETSIPLGQKQPSIITSFNSENTSNNDQQEAYLIVNIN